MTHPTMIDSGQMNMVPESRAGNDSLHILFLGAPATAAIPAHSVQIPGGKLTLTWCMDEHGHTWPIYTEDLHTYSIYSL